MLTRVTWMFLCIRTGFVKLSKEYLRYYVRARSRVRVVDPPYSPPLGVFADMVMARVSSER